MITYIVAEVNFSVDNMLTSLMLNGYYCYHDAKLKSLLPSTINWTKDRANFYIAKDSEVINFVQTQQQHTFPIFYDLEPLASCISYGIDDYAGNWHDHQSMQVLCYQEDSDIEDGGALGITAYDGTEKHYMPKNGDLMILAVGVMHKVFPLTTDKKRIVINVSYKFKTQQD